MKDHLQSVFGPQGESGIRDNRMIGYQFHTKPLEDRGQYERPLDQGELHTDADAGAAAEGEVGEPVPIGGGGREKAFGLESFGFLPKLRMAMRHPLTKNNGRLGR